jgi:nucleoside-triphosphatase THEP1
MEASMINNLFLFGTIGAGKSTLIRQFLRPYLPEVGGFYVQRILYNKELVAFSLKPVDHKSDYQLTLEVNNLMGLDNLFLYADDQGNWQRDVHVFQNSGALCLRNSRQDHKKLILLDELGGIELHNQVFMAEVYKTLNSSTPVLGVVKAPDNARILESVEAGKGATDVNLTFIDYLNNDQETELLDIDNINRNEVTFRVKSFIGAVFNE